MKSYEKMVSPLSDYYVYVPSVTAQDMYFYPLSVGHFIYESGYFLCRSSYDSFLLIFVSDGSLVLNLDGMEVTASPGEFALIDCYRSHAYSAPAGCDAIWMHFDGILARKFYETVTDHLGNVFLLANPHPALNKLNTIYRTFKEGARLQEALISKYINDILTAFILYSPDADNSHDHADAAEKAISYINEHFSEDIPVEKLAAIAGMSLYHFIRVFKGETGFTPHEYIVKIRLNTAMYLLKNTSLPVKNICFQTGFSNESVFCSTFKKKLGMTPAQYRNSSGI